MPRSRPKELGLKTTMLGNNSWYEPMDKVAGAAADGAYFPLNISRDDPSLKVFIDKYNKEYDEFPRLHSFSGWDDIGFSSRPLKRSKSTDPKKIRDTMAADDQVRGGDRNDQYRSQDPPPPGVENVDP